MAKTDISVGSLVDMITRGDLRLPELQRRYVWPATRVRDLCDSLYRGYPSGTILVWETDQAIPTRDTSVKQETGAFRPKLLLDGQQRLTSLSALIRGEPIRLRNRVRPIEIAFNLDHPEGPPVDVMEVEGDEQTPVEDGETDEVEEGPTDTVSVQERVKNRAFVVATNQLLADKHWVKVTDIFSSKRDWELLKPLGLSAEDPKYDFYSKRLQRVRAIREYSYVMHVLERNLSYEEVAEIFVRVNSLGMKLRGSDLALAQITARWQHSLQLFESFAEECETVSFTLDVGLIVRALVAFATKQSRFRTVATIPVDTLKQSWEQAKDGMRFAISFLRANGAIEDASLLSSPFLVIPIAVFAVLKKHKLSADEGRGLMQWLFVANAKGHYSGSSETVLDGDLNILFRGGGPTELLDALKQQRGRLRFEAGDFVARGERNPLFSATYLALKHAGAKDWWSGLGLSLTHQGKSHNIQFHHIFPKSVLVSTKSIENGETKNIENSEINEIANMAFISGKQNRVLGNKTPDVYFPSVVEARGTDALQSQRIPLAPELWKVDRYRDFLAYRRADLAKALNDYVDDLGSGTRPSVDVQALIESGESQTVEFKATARFNAHTGSADKVLEGVIAKTIAGFMNADGGSLIVGVNDAGIPVGIDGDLTTLGKRPDHDGFEQFLIGLVAQAIGKDRCPLVSTSFHGVDSKDVCVVEVHPSPRPAYVNEGNERRLYVRTGNTTRPLTTEEAVAYIGEHWA